MSEIGHMKKLLIGISCMQAEQEYPQPQLLRNAWNTRFAGNDMNAILVEADKMQEPEQIIGVVGKKLQEQGLFMMQRNVVLAVFADMRDAEQAAFVRKMENMKKHLYEALACTVEEQLVFAYLDDCSMSPRNVRERLKESVRESWSDSFKMILVGRFALTPPEELWRGELALLDVLCRDQDELSGKLLPYGFGFLKYGSCQPEKRRELLRKQRKLEKKLNSDEQGDFKELVDRYVREKITDVIEDQCSPEEGMAPIAPGMLVSGWLAVRSAKKGKNREYDRACDLTEDAVKETARCMEDYADELAGTMAKEADEILWDLMEVSNAGVDFLKRRDRMCDLMQNFRRAASCEKLKLYGCVEMDEIQKGIYHYLKGVMQYVQVQAERVFRDALVEAYEHISLENWNEKEMAYRNEYQNVCGRLRQYPELQVFCEHVYEKKPFLNHSFMPIAGRNMASEHYFLLHGDGLEESGRSSDVTRIHYDSRTTGYEGAEVLITFLYKQVGQEFDRIVNDLLKLEA